jgi:hypothetical protein
MARLFLICGIIGSLPAATVLRASASAGGEQGYLLGSALHPKTQLSSQGTIHVENVKRATLDVGQEVW